MRYNVTAVSAEEEAMCEANPNRAPAEHVIDTINADFWKAAEMICAKRKKAGQYPRSAMIVQTEA